MGGGLSTVRILATVLSENGPTIPVDVLLIEVSGFPGKASAFQEGILWTLDDQKFAVSRGDLNNAGWVFGYDGAGRLGDAVVTINPSEADQPSLPSAEDRLQLHL